MGQEFFINSQELENKVRTLLPSQGGAGAGFDLSASTQIIPIIDLTESAEGSNLRQDLQTSYSFDTTTVTQVSNTTTVILNTTGFYRIFGTNVQNGASGCRIELSDGASVKILFNSGGNASSNFCQEFDFIVKINAGDSCQVVSTGTTSFVTVATKQIASIDGQLS